MKENYHSLENEGHAIRIIDKNVPRFYVRESMFKLKHLIEGIKRKLIDVSDDELKSQNKKVEEKKWLNDGVEVEILKVGSLGWQKGKLKINISVEFSPDDSLENTEI